MATPSIGDECLEEALTEQFFLKLMNDVSDDSKVEKMAIHLNISQATLASLKKEFRVDTPLLATKMLMAWRSNLTCDRVEDAKQQLTAALRSVGLARKAKLVTLALQRETCAETDGPTLQVQSPPHRHNILTGLPNFRKRCTAGTCGWITCYTTLVMLIVVFAAAILSASKFPKTNNSISPPSIRANDTAELSFSLPTTWLEKLSLSIDSACTGAVYTHHGKCSSLYSKAQVCYQQSEYAEDAKAINYLLPGSSIYFRVAANFSCDLAVWIIWNPDLLYTTDLSTISCDNPPPQTQCLHPLINQTETTYLHFNVTEPAYYKHSYSTTCDIRRYYNICSYDVSKLSELASAVTQDPVESNLVDIDILYKLYKFSEVCMIFHVENQNYDCINKYEGGQLHAEMSRRQDILLLPTLLTSVAVFVLLVMSGTHILWCVLRHRQRARNQYRILHSNEEQV
jgi:hypothetical protein